MRKRVRKRVVTSDASGGRGIGYPYLRCRHHAHTRPSSGIAGSTGER
jgi:hypothetical protein